MFKAEAFRRASILTILLLAASVGAPLTARADQADTLSFSAGLTRQYDNNLFRLPGNLSPLPFVGKSARDDRITSTTLGIAFKKAYSLQQFEAGWDHVSTRYDTYGFLNNDADNARAAWRWQFTPRLKGNLTYNRTQALVGFGDYTNYGTRNIRTTTVTRADADWDVLHGPWHLLAGVDHNEARNSQLFTQDEGSRVASADFAVRHLFPSGNWIDFLTRVGTGEYLGRRIDVANQLDTGFRDRRHELRAHWAGGKTSLDASLGYAARDSDHFAGRDYSGGIGSLKWTWTPTGKLALLASWKRDLAAYTDAISSYYLQDVYSISPVWQVDAKLRLSLKLDSTKRDFRGAITSLPFNRREDRNDTAQFSAEWTPLRTVTVSGFVLEDSRHSSLAGSAYKDRILGASARLEF